MDIDIERIKAAYHDVWLPGREGQTGASEAG